MRRWLAGLVAVGLACGATPREAAAPAGAEPSPAEDEVAPIEVAQPEVAHRDEVAHLRVRVLAVHPHDPGAYTQGLLWHEGAVLESTGRYGASSLLRWELESGTVLDRLDLPPELFGEGLARVDRRLIQLTWREGRARIYDLDRFRFLSEVAYQGEGWGLCYDGRRLVMSDGSDRLTFRDPVSLAPLGEVAVTLEGRPLRNLNELECRPEGIYANLWGRDEIARIDPASGRVEAVIDAAGLLTARERAAAEVLNGIAYRSETHTFLITGKLWPKLFEVELVAAPHPLQPPGGG